MKKIVYLTGTRFPTNKASGLQICKTCEGFAANHTDVMLFYPRRKLSKTVPPQKDLLESYGIEKAFHIRPLFNADVFILENILPGKLFSFLYTLHAFLWGMFAAFKAQREKAALYYTRDIAIAVWLGLFNLPLAFEAHAAPGRLEKKLLPLLAKKPGFRALVIMAALLKPVYQKLGIPADKTILSHHGFSPDHFSAVPDRETCRKRLELPMDKKIIGYIGKFKSVGKDKGVAGLVQMTADFQSPGGSPPLLLCVGGPLSAVPDYLRRAEELKIPETQLKFVGHVPHVNIPLWMGACDILLLPLTPSFMENIGAMPLKLFEYMAATVPVVAADLPPIREYLVHRQNALLVDPKDPSAMAAAVSEILTDPEFGRRLAVQARNDVEKFSWEYRACTLIKALNLVDRHLDNECRMSNH